MGSILPFTEEGSSEFVPFLLRWRDRGNNLPILPMRLALQVPLLVEVLDLLTWVEVLDLPVGKEWVKLLHNSQGWSSF